MASKIPITYVPARNTIFLSFLSIATTFTHIVARGLVSLHIQVSDLEAQTESPRQGQVKGSVDVVAITVLTEEVRRIIISDSYWRLRWQIRQCIRQTHATFYEARCVV